jgi:hypothetical protein
MIQRLIFGLAIMIVLVEPTIAASVVRIRVRTEDAYVNQCRDGICATVQVTRETFSNGETHTLLFVSANDESGNAIFPVCNVPIDNSLFVMNRQGTGASVNHPMASVIWTFNGLYTEEADSTRKVVDKRESPFTEPQAFRLTERERIQSATAEGTAGGPCSGDETSPTTIGINSEVLSSGGFVNSFITVRRTTRIDRIFPSNE